MIKTIPIFLPGDKLVYITAGPTREMPANCRLIRCAAEIPVARDVIAFDVSVTDFTPFDDDTILANINGIIDALIDGEELFVGCMGGTGRTGTMLAILAAQHPAMTGPNAIQYIRQIYKSGAVETANQAEQVDRLAHCYIERVTRPEVAALEDAGFYMDPPPVRVPWYKRLFGWG